MISWGARKQEESRSGKGFLGNPLAKGAESKDVFSVNIAALWNSPDVCLLEEHPALQDWLRGREEFEGHVIFRTSGSSGVEKWVALSKNAMEWSAARVIEHLTINGSDLSGVALPLIHVGGFGQVLRAYLAGSQALIFPQKWRAEEFGLWVRSQGVTLTSLVPAQVRDLVEERIRAPRSLRSVIVGGGALDSELVKKARLLGWPIELTYGMTETSSQVAIGDQLLLYPGWQARIQNGCLALKGGGLFSSLITHENGTFCARDPKVDGWFFTQDHVTLTNGSLTILGRADRRVKVLGELVDLEALENYWCKKTGGVVAIVTSPHPRRGVGLFLFLEGREDSVEEINQALPGPERVMAWKVLPELPRSALGKVDRGRLAAQFLAENH